jgi:hypothetical protein
MQTSVANDLKGFVRKSWRPTLAWGVRQYTLYGVGATLGALAAATYVAVRVIFVAQPSIPATREPSTTAAPKPPDWSQPAAPSGDELISKARESARLVSTACNSPDYRFKPLPNAEVTYNGDEAAKVAEIISDDPASVSNAISAGCVKNFSQQLQSLSFDATRNDKFSLKVIVLQQQGVLRADSQTSAGSSPTDGDYCIRASSDVLFVPETAHLIVVNGDYAAARILTADAESICIETHGSPGQSPVEAHIEVMTISKLLNPGRPLQRPSFCSAVQKQPGGMWTIGPAGMSINGLGFKNVTFGPHALRVNGVDITDFLQERCGR